MDNQVTRRVFGVGVLSLVLILVLMDNQVTMYINLLDSSGVLS